MSLSQFLQTTTVADLIRYDTKYSDLVYVITTTTIQECLSLLMVKDIISVPIFDEKEKNFVGIIDVFQITSFFAFSGLSENPDFHNFHNSGNLRENFSPDLTVPVVDVVTPDLCFLESSTPFKETLEWLAQGTRRILVSQENGTHVLITQTDLIRYLYKNIEKFGDIKEATLELGENQKIQFLKKVSTVTTDGTALRAFQIMHVKDTEVIAVVDSLGSLVADVSGANLRGFTKEKLNTLFFPVLEFLDSQGSRNEPVSCSQNDTIQTVMELMIKQHVHFIWIVDKNKKPEGVVSMTDIASYFYSQTLDLWYQE